METGKEKMLEEIEQLSEKIDKESVAWRVYFRRGYFYGELNESDSAINDYTKAIELNLEEVYSYYNRAIEYSKCGELDKAIDDYGKEIKGNLNYANAYNNRGAAYQKLGLNKKAIEDYTSAIKINNNDLIPYRNRAKLNKYLGHWRKALEDFKEVKKIENKDFVVYVEQIIKDKHVEECLFHLLTATMLLKESCIYKKEIPVGHYTKINTLECLVRHESKEDKEKARLRLNNVAYMNDPSEGKVFFDCLIGHGKAMNKKIDKAKCWFYDEEEQLDERIVLNGDSHTYLASFSLAIDSLPMWVQYSDDGKGGCLILEHSFFDGKESNAFHKLIDSKITEYENIEDTSKESQGKQQEETYCLYEVNYINIDSPEIHDSEKEKYMDEIRIALLKLYECIVPLDTEMKTKVKKIAITILDQVRFLFKSSDYAHEKEIRLVKLETRKPKSFRSEEMTVPHLYINLERDLHFKEIILGPKVENSIEIAAYLHYTEKVDKVTKSKIKYQ